MRPRERDLRHPVELTDGELVGRTDRRHVRICSEQRDQLRDFVHIDSRRLWQRDGARDMAGWIAARYDYSPWEARRWTSAAHAVENLTLVGESLTNGELSMTKVLELARFASPATEKKLISWSKKVSPRAIRKRADRELRPHPEDAKDAERQRFVRWWFSDHIMGLEGQFPAAQGAEITKAISRLADQLPETPDDELPDEVVILDEDLVDQRRADALYLIAAGYNAKDADENRATVVVHKTVGPGMQWNELERGITLDPEISRRLTCDARLQFVLTDADGNALGIGRTARDIPLWLERLVRERDGWECSFPGCGMANFLKSHHIWHWEDGGPTDLPNLITVCHAHHKLVHEFGWRVALNGTLAEWFRPSGTPFDPGPDPPQRTSSRQTELISSSALPP